MIQASAKTICLMLLLALPVAVAASAERRPAQTADISQVRQVDQLAAAPDGSRVLFRKAGPGEGEKQQVGFWLADADGGAASRVAQLGEHDTRVSWVAGGGRIAFLRPVDGVRRLHLLDAGGEAPACVLADIPGDVDDYLWSPDGTRLAIVGTGNNGATAATPPGVRIFTRADYRSGSSYVDHRPESDVMIIEAGPGCSGVRPLRSQRVAGKARLSFWSPGAQEVYFTTDAAGESYYGGGQSSLWSLGPDGPGPRRELDFVVPGTDRPMARAPDLSVSPDGTRVAFSLGDPSAPSAFAQRTLFVMDLADGQARNITPDHDRDLGSGGIVWRDNGHLVSIEYSQGSANLVEVSVATGAVSGLWRGPFVVHDFSLASDAGRIFAVMSDFTSPREVYAVGDDSGTRLTDANGQLRDTLLLTGPEEMWFQGPAGHAVHAFVQKPPQFDPEGKYPAIVWAHGGPHHWWSRAFDAEIQAMAAAGYIVMFPNPVGSVSYGQAFASALSDDWPGADYEDVMAGVEVLSTRPYVDTGRIGIAGSSAGGILTNWAITSTDRFGAAVSISSIADFTMYWFIGDQPSLSDPTRRPWLDESDRQRSPISRGAEIVTPTLFIEGTSDYRTPSEAGGKMMFRLLKHLRVPTAMVQFEGAGHSIYQGTDYRHRSLRIHYLLRWMDHHLLGKPAPEFEAVVPG